MTSLLSLLFWYYSERTTIYLYENASYIRQVHCFPAYT